LDKHTGQQAPREKKQRKIYIEIIKKGVLEWGRTQNPKTVEVERIFQLIMSDMWSLPGRFSKAGAVERICERGTVEKTANSARKII